MIAAVVILLLLGGGIAYKIFGGKPTPKYGNGKLVSISDHATNGLTEKPTFALYYPSQIPAGLVLDRESIKYAKDSFIFNIKQAGQNRFFVSEQPVGSRFSFDSFKKKLVSPIDIKTNFGKGVIDGINGGLLTIAKTPDDTLIIVNCVNTVCSATSKELINHMQLVSDFSRL